MKSSPNLLGDVRRKWPYTYLQKPHLSTLIQTLIWAWRKFITGSFWSLIVFFGVCSPLSPCNACCAMCVLCCAVCQPLTSKAQSNELSSIYPSKGEHKYPLPQPRKEFQSSPTEKGEWEHMWGRTVHGCWGHKDPISGTSLAARWLWASGCSGALLPLHLSLDPYPPNMRLPIDLLPPTFTYSGDWLTSYSQSRRSI